MSIHNKRGSFTHAYPGCRVVATIGGQLLPQLRDALAPLGLASVLVSSAVSWSDQGSELVYRGQRIIRDREVARVEISCAEQQVERILNAFDSVTGRKGAEPHAPGFVVVYPLLPAFAGPPSAELPATA
jgi:hypothetical protein